MLVPQNPPLGGRQRRLPPPSEPLRTPGYRAQPRAWRPCRPSACITQPGPRACLHPAGVRGRRHLESPVLGPGEGAFGHRKIRRARGVDRRLQTLGGGGGGGIRGGLRFQTRGRSESAPGPRPKGERGKGGGGRPQTRRGEGAPGRRTGMRGEPEPRTVTWKWGGSPPLLTSEHRLGPRNYGHHHGLLLVLPFLAFERHLEAVERGALGLQGHGAAGGIAVTGRWRTGAQAWARCRAPPPPARAAPCPPPASRRACDGRVRASPRPEASGPRAGRAQSGAPAPRRSLLWRLIVGARPAGRGPAPDSRAANRARLRPVHAAPLESQDPPGGGKGRAGCWRPSIAEGVAGPAGEDPGSPRRGHPEPAAPQWVAVR